jgi:hypothetical protein
MAVTRKIAMTSINSIKEKALREDRRQKREGRGQKTEGREGFTIE